MWGTGASSTQTEGASPASDWLQWERDGHAPTSGDGSGFATRLVLWYCASVVGWISGPTLSCTASLPASNSVLSPARSS